ncbi:MAG: DUF305 domain-containing protein [Actinomycetota bacterium]|nr:DUF305 domain-containing protein [Actinomycetota bacterium]
MPNPRPPQVGDRGRGETIIETSSGSVGPSSAEGRAAAGPPPARWIQLLVYGGATLAVLLLGAALGMLLHRGGGAPIQSEAGTVDIGFAQDMSEHHRQAVLMAGLARERSNDPAIRSLAFDIETSQLEQTGRMQGWLSLWNAAALSTGRHMTWMTDTHSMPGPAHGVESHTTGVATMPGMASPADLEQLRASSGTEFDVLFLQLMLRHHQGGVPMAQYAAQHAETPQVRNLAEKIVASQGAESKYMAQLITQRGAQPLAPPS